jgi:hypothetical protein
MELQNVTIKRIGKTESVGEKGFQKTQIVVEIPGEYPQTLQIEACGRKADIFQDYQPGDIVSCKISLKGKEWVNSAGETKVINTIDVWAVSGNATAKPKPVLAGAPSDNGDLPF